MEIECFKRFHSLGALCYNCVYTAHARSLLFGPYWLIFFTRHCCDILQYYLLLVYTIISMNTYYKQNDYGFSNRTTPKKNSLVKTTTIKESYPTKKPLQAFHLFWTVFVPNVIWHATAVHGYFKYIWQREEKEQRRKPKAELVIVTL